MAESLKEQKLGVSTVLWSCNTSLKTFTTVRSLATYQEKCNILLTRQMNDCFIIHLQTRTIFPLITSLKRRTNMSNKSVILFNL